MYNAFNMQSDDAGLGAQSASPIQSPLTEAAAWSREELSDTLLDSVASLSRISAMSVVEHGARHSVVGELLLSILTHLPLSMQADIAKAFRNRIDGLMSLGDDRYLPERYHSALLTEVNRYLNVLP
ncbi:MAG TPA: hypothetical protein VG105_02885 [Paraburkholderia sp.]|jgi:hypothetical protein|nr:hypothetical protein [Paraburkholderia sp.]